MSLKPTLKFSLAVLGDGSSRVFTSTIATAPLGFQIPAALGGTNELSPGFLFTTVPTGITNVATYNGHGITATILLGVVTFTYDAGDMPDANEHDIIYGDLLF